MSKKIRFMAMNKEVEAKFEPPKPAKSYVPEWYKKAKRFRSGKMQILPNNNGINKDIKLCVPFLDALTSGYIIELPNDLLIQRSSDGVGFFWNEQPGSIEVRPKDMAVTLPRPSGHDPDLYAWHTWWAVIVPPGYSVLYTHPLNRFDLPFVTTSGVVDADGFSLGGELPFFLKEGFEGVIPAGTPIVQAIPFKRQDWDSEVIPSEESFVKAQTFKVAKFLHDGYKKVVWVKKSYN